MRVGELTTFGVGGECRLVVRVTTPEELVAAVIKCEQDKIPYRLIAGGSNVVWQDAPFAGAVIKYAVAGELNKNLTITGSTIFCEAGVILADLINLAIKHNLAGLESLSGIPGTVGGAIVGNAGAYGQGISDKLIAIVMWDGKRVRVINKSAGQFKYRDSIFKHKDYLVLAATFKLERGEKKVLSKKAREIIKLREKKYPPQLKCPGSFFKNILAQDVSKAVLKKIDPTKITHGKIPAGYLLEVVGARGLKSGGVKVADYHGNLIINTGKGKYQEVKQLAQKLKGLVISKFGLRLEEEIRYLP